MTDPFPDVARIDVRKTTNAFWEFRNAVPFPRGDWLHCPICGGQAQARWWQWHTRPAGHTIPWRCDVSFKCTGCAYVWFHGVALSKVAWDKRPFPRRDRTKVKWREVMAVIEDEAPDATTTHPVPPGG